jgi:anti-sigma regulatory factor (Ser/Thr protein kinase)
MPTHQQPFRFVLHNDLAELERLSEILNQIKHQWQLTDIYIMQLNLVLDELFTNVVSYGYDEESEEQVIFTLNRNDNEVEVSICDYGKPFDPTLPGNPNPDVPLGDKQLGGLGIFLVRQYTDTLTYRREKNKNIVTLTKKI